MHTEGTFENANTFVSVLAPSPHAVVHGIPLGRSALLHRLQCQGGSRVTLDGLRAD